MKKRAYVMDFGYMGSFFYFAFSSFVLWALGRFKRGAILTLFVIVRDSIHSPTQINNNKVLFFGGGILYSFLISFFFFRRLQVIRFVIF